MNKQKIALRSASILWAIWGVFHVLAGIAMIYLFGVEHPDGTLSAVPEFLNLNLMGDQKVFPIVPALKQHGFNLAWFGVIVTIGCVYVWKESKLAILTCVLTGGLADLGYFLYVDLAGFSDSLGSAMTYIMATAIILGLYGYFRLKSNNNGETQSIQ